MTGCLSRGYMDEAATGGALVYMVEGKTAERRTGWGRGNRERIWRGAGTVKDPGENFVDGASEGRAAQWRLGGGQAVGEGKLRV